MSLCIGAIIDAVSGELDEYLIRGVSSSMKCVASSAMVVTGNAVDALRRVDEHATERVWSVRTSM